MPTLRWVLAATSLVAASVGGAAEPGENGWVRLFNGRDLDGWTPKVKGFPLGENFGDTFRVEDGVLQVRYDQYEGPFRGRFGHLFYAHEFSNYELRFEYRFVGEQYPLGSPGWAVRNSGVMVHGQAPETMERNQNFPVSIEVQLLGGDGNNPRSTANLCTPGTHVVMDGELITRHCTNSESDTFHGSQWVTCAVEVRGNSVIRHRVNGDLVMEYQQPQLDPADQDAAPRLAAGWPRQLTRGTISFQSESHPVDFRNVELRQLED